MRFLISGGAGYIGSTVAHYLIDRGHEVTIVDNLLNGFRRNIPKKATFFKIDISDTKKLNNIFLIKKFDFVFHFAALINNEESLKYPKRYFKNNYEKGKIFLQCCIENNLTNIIYSSTAAVYGNRLKKVDENDLLNPISPYSRSKLKLENFLKKNKEKINCIILRYFNVAGTDIKYRCGFNINNKYNLILNLCAACIKNKKFAINGDKFKTKDGTTIRDFIHVLDLAQIHVLLAKKLYKKKTFKIFNCGYGQGSSVREILNKFIFIKRKKIKFIIGNKRPKDIIISVANPIKLMKYISWKPKYNNLTHIVKSSLNWYQKQSR